MCGPFNQPVIVTDILCANFLPCVFCAKDVINASVSAFSWWVREVSGRVPGFMCSWMDELHFATFIKNIKKWYLQLFLKETFTTTSSFWGWYPVHIQVVHDYRTNPPKALRKASRDHQRCNMHWPSWKRIGSLCRRGVFPDLEMSAREEQDAESDCFPPMRPTKNTPDSLCFFLTGIGRYSV